MIVGQTEANRIFSGRQVQRRFGPTRRAPQVGAVVPVTFRRPNPALGFTAIGHPREEPIRACYIRVHERWDTLWANVTAEDVEAEGFKSLDDLAAAHEHPAADDPFTVIRFEVDRSHRPRLLSVGVEVGRQSDYVEHPARALPDEAEAIDIFTQERFSAEAREEDRKRVIRKWEELAEQPIEVQFGELVAEARRRHIDIRDEMRGFMRYSDPGVRAQKLERLREKVVGVATAIVA